MDSQCGCAPPVAVCAGVIRGPFQLHPSSQTRSFPTCLLNFKLPADQLLRHLHSVADWQQLPVLTDADITARATRLGLLPAKTLEAKGGCLCVCMRSTLVGARDCSKHSSLAYCREAVTLACIGCHHEMRT
jgi:hypothetical protein